MENKEQKKVLNFGDGELYARGSERKLVTPNQPDFTYVVKDIGIREVREPIEDQLNKLLLGC